MHAMLFRLLRVWGGIFCLLGKTENDYKTIQTASPRHFFKIWFEQKQFLFARQTTTHAVRPVGKNSLLKFGIYMQPQNSLYSVEMKPRALNRINQQMLAGKKSISSTGNVDLKPSALNSLKTNADNFQQYRNGNDGDSKEVIVGDHKKD